MNTTIDTSRPVPLEDHRPLADSDLDAVTGGSIIGYPVLTEEIGYPPSPLAR